MLKTSNTEYKIKRTKAGKFNNYNGKNKLILIIIGILLLASVSFVYAEIIWSDGTITEFEITSTEPICENGVIWKEWVGGEWVESSSLKNCTRFDSDGNIMTCCPNEGEPECILDPLDSNYGKCKGLPMPRYCAGYTLDRYDGDEDLTKEQCTGATFDVANRSMVDYTDIDNICGGYSESSVIDGEICYKFSLGCRCEWDDINDICEARVSWTDWICPGETNITISGECNFVEIGKEDDCENSGYIFYSWEATWIDDEADKPGWCEDGSRKYRCAAKLAFFTIASFIVAIILIVIIYFIWFKKGKKRK